MPRLLILGSHGFLGRSIAHHLAGEHPDVELVLHRRPAAAPAAPHVLDDLERCELDLLRSDVDEIGRLIDHVGPDAIVNCVGAVSGEPAELRLANLVVVERIVAALAGRRRVHLVHLGSAAEYGLQQPQVPVREDLFAAPTSAYGMTKLQGTQHLVAAARDGAVTATVLRVFNPLGAFSSPLTLAGRAAAAVDTARREGRHEVLLGPLDAWRDFIDTRDVADAVLATCEARRCGRLGDGTVVNVGSGVAAQARELVQKLCAIAGFDGTVVEQLPPSHRSGAVDWQAADVDVAARLLGWRATRTLDDAVADLWHGRVRARAAT